jgi:mono/diheme cytochrome c family protein
MTVFYLKSLLSLVLLLPASYGMYTMFKIFGGAVAENVTRIKLRHKVAGYLYVLIVLVISYLCAGFAAASKAEPSPRAVVHIVLALTILTLFVVKVLFIHRFRQFYAQAKTIGIAIGVMSFVMIGISGGYYLIMTRFGQDRSVDKSVYYQLERPFLTVVRIGGPGLTSIRTDRTSIGMGRTLFTARCSACHDPLSTITIVGPGLKGLLKNPKLPKSGHPATAESIRFQLRQPLGSMPSFAYLTEDEMEDLIAYLNTL